MNYSKQHQEAFITMERNEIEKGLNRLVSKLSSVGLTAQEAGAALREAVRNKNDNIKFIQTTPEFRKHISMKDKEYLEGIDWFVKVEKEDDIESMLDDELNRTIQFCTNGF